MSENLEPKNSLQRFLQKAGATLKPGLEKLHARWAQSEAPAKVREFLSAKAAKWRLRERLVKVLPQDLAKSLPRTFEPLAVAEWMGQALQRQGAAFYGKLLTVVLCMWFLADITALLIGKHIPEPPVSHLFRQNLAPKRARSLEDYAVIMNRNLFNSQHLIPGEDNVTGEVSPSDLGGAPVKTSLPFNLLGTLILHDEVRSIATIEDKSANAVYPVRVDDEIPTKAKILKVEPYRVIFINTSTGRREFVELPQDLAVSNPRITLGTAKRTSGPGIERTAPNHFNVARQEVDKALGDMNNVLTQARCIPQIENGVAAGYKCFQIVPGSIYDKLGMQNGDIICGINGQSLNDPAKAFEQLSGLKEASHIELCIKRDGRQQTFQYDIR